MLTWGQVIILLLRMANSIMTAINREKWMQAGMDAEIAKASAAILAKTEYARKLREKIDAMDDTAIDAALRDLEPK